MKSLVCIADPMASVLVSELQTCEGLVLARPAEDDGRFEVTKVLRSKTGVGVGDSLEAKLPLFSEDGGKIGRSTVLLTRRTGEEGWVIRAPASEPEQTAFYDEVLSEMSARVGDVLDETNRAVFYVGYLHHEDPLLAKAAAFELAKMPYLVMKRVRTKLDAEKIRQELASQGVRERRALFQTLLGLCGTLGSDQADKNPNRAAGYYLEAARLSRAGASRGGTESDRQLRLIYNDACSGLAAVLHEEGHDGKQSVRFVGPLTPFRLALDRSEKGAIDPSFFDEVIRADHLKLEHADLPRLRQEGIGGALVAHHPRRGVGKEGQFVGSGGIALPVNAALDFPSRGEARLRLRNLMQVDHVQTA